MVNPLQRVSSWLYHLGNVDPAEAVRIGANNAGLVVIDYATDGATGTRGHTAAELNVMRGGQNKLIVSYLSIGEAEDYRPYWQSSWNSNPPSFLSASNPEWPDNYKVKYWDPAWQKIIFDYVDKIIAAGFNGVYMDIIDAYQYWEEIDPVPGMNYGQKMADFVGAIRAHANAKLAQSGDSREFVLIGQNGEELLSNSTYLNAVDGVGKEDLRFYYPNGEEGSFAPTPNGWYDGTKEFLELAEAAGKQAFVVEYLTAARQSQYRSTLDAEHNYLVSKGIPLYVSEDRDLTHIYTQPYPSGGLNGTSGPDILNGTSIADIMNGFAGDDILNGGGGIDTMIGGAGNDTYYVDARGDIVVEAVGQGAADTVLASASYALAATANVERLATTSAAGTNAIDLTGNSLAQIITGNAGANVIDDGGGAADRMAGLGGNDTYHVRNAGDVIIEAAGGGTDRVMSSVSYALTAGAAIEYLRTASDAGLAAIRLTGNAFAQQLIGNAGANTLDGGGGGDWLWGLGGNDSYLLRSSHDVIMEAAAGGFDRAYAAVSFSLSAAAAVEYLGTADYRAQTTINLVGNAFGQSVVGNAGSNQIYGKGGNDRLTGLGGKDFFTFDTALNAATNVDGITDFSVTDDTIRLDDAIFTQANGSGSGGTGVLNAGEFAKNATGVATGVDDRIIYDTSNGWLSYDADGSGAGSAIHFARLLPHLALTYADFQVF